MKNLIFLFVFVFLILGCGEGGGKNSQSSDSLSPESPGETLTAISIYPDDIILHVGDDLQLSAKGTYSSGSVVDITEEVDWISSGPDVVQVSDLPGEKGMLTGNDVGTATVTARLNGIEGFATVSITPAELLAIEVRPTNSSLTINETGQFSAIGIYSDGSRHDLTESASWSSSSPTIATVNDSPGVKGLVLGVSTGVASITAKTENIFGSTEITISTVELIAAWMETGFNFDSVIDGSGRSHTAISKSIEIDGHLFAHQHDPLTNESTVTLLQSELMDDRIINPRIATNLSGKAFAAWTGLHGVYGCSYTPEIGWQPPEIISDGMPASSLAVSIDGSGNVMVAWGVANANGTGYDIISRAYTPEGGWSDSEVLGTTGYAFDNISLAVSENGTALLTWPHWDLFGTGRWTLYARNFIMAEGWQDPVILSSGRIYNSNCLAINDNGYGIVAWSDPDTFPNPVYASFFTPGVGWSNPAQVGTSIAGSSSLHASINNSLDAIISWTGYASSFNVFTNRFVPNLGWQGEQVVRAFLGSYPSQIQFKIDSVGKIVGIWISPLPNGSYSLESIQFSPELGWGEIEELGGISGTSGTVVDAVLTLNANGAFAITWSELWDYFNGQFFESFSDLYQYRGNTNSQ